MGKLKCWKKDGKDRWNIERKDRGKYDFDILTITKYSPNVLFHTYPYTHKVKIYKELSNLKEEKKVIEFKDGKLANQFANKYMKSHDKC